MNSLRSSVFVSLKLDHKVKPLQSLCSVNLVMEQKEACNQRKGKPRIFMMLNRS